MTDREPGTSKEMDVDTKKDIDVGLQLMSSGSSAYVCCDEIYYYYYYYCRFTALWILSETTRLSRYRKVKTKTSLDFLEQEILSGSGISWAICKSAPYR